MINREFVICTYAVQRQQVQKEQQRNKQNWGTFLSEDNDDGRKHQKYILNFAVVVAINLFVFKASENCIHTSKAEASHSDFLEAETSLFTILTDTGF